MNTDIRWHQRYEYFCKALVRFSEVAMTRDLNDIEENGMIQRFEFTLELGWKVMRDFLFSEGISVWSPKETMRQAFESGYISDWQVWMDMIDLRNTFSHDYDGTFFHKHEVFLRNEAFGALKDLQLFFQWKVWKEK
jgi:nucleotidyltransferase substrate binding protein (TIGR01987 family)